MYKKYLILLFILLPTNLFAFDITFPVQCNYGKDCFIRSYFDHGEEDVVEDYNCGNLSTNNQKHTEIMLKSYAQMRAGVDVVSVEDGKIIAVRDGMDDVGSKLIGSLSIRGRECGNGVIIEHKRGYQTQYCHLKKNSIVVKQGQKVEKGEIIAQVGLSGATNFPHLEFRTTRNNFVFDPFMGDQNLLCGSRRIYPSWDKLTRKKLRYIPTVLLNFGFYNKVPHAEGARQGKFFRTEIAADSKILTFWVDVFGLQKGDEISLYIYYPNGEEMIVENKIFKKEKRQHFQFVGKRLQQNSWPIGKYKGRMVLKRGEEGGKVVVDEDAEFEVVL